MANEISGLSQIQTSGSSTRMTAPAAASEAVSQAEKPQMTTGDTVTLSSNAKMLQRLESALADNAGIDRQRFDHVKHEIAAGRYPVDNGRLAQQFDLLKPSTGMEPGGHHIQQTVDISRTEDGRELTVTRTDARGRTRTFEATTAFDRENKTITRDVTRTGNEGGQMQRHAEFTRTDNGYTYDMTVTTPDGRQLAREVEQTFDAESNTLTRQISLSNADGREVTRTIEITRAGGKEPFADTPVMPPTSDSTDT